MAKHKSMKGEEVDVDLIRMKQELLMGAKTDPSIKREDYINGRRRRSSSKRINEMLANEQMIRQKLNEQKNANALDVEALEASVDQDNQEESSVEKTQPVTKNRTVRK